MPRSELRLVVRFLCWFLPAYGLLIMPWPGSRDLYGSYLRSFTNLVLTDNTGHRFLHFDEVPAATRNRTLDTRITIANRQQLDTTSSSRALMLDIDSRGLGWVPTALLIALTLASPVSWPRRLWALVWGLLAVHAIILFSILISIWNLSDAANGLNLIQLSPFWKTIVSGLEETLVTQLGASFVLPFLVWIFATFRIEDVRTLTNKYLTETNAIDQPSA